MSYLVIIGGFFLLFLVVFFLWLFVWVLAFHAGGYTSAEDYDEQMMDLGQAQQIGAAITDRAVR